MSNNPKSCWQFMERHILYIFISTYWSYRLMCSFWQICACTWPTLITTLIVPYPPSVSHFWVASMCIYNRFWNIFSHACFSHIHMMIYNYQLNFIFQLYKVLKVTYLVKEINYSFIDLFMVKLTGIANRFLPWEYI